METVRHVILGCFAVMPGAIYGAYIRWRLYQDRLNSPSHAPIKE